MNKVKKTFRSIPSKETARRSSREISNAIAAIVSVARVIATVHITLSLPCGE